MGAGEFQGSLFHCEASTVSSVPVESEGRKWTPTFLGGGRSEAAKKKKEERKKERTNERTNERKKERKKERRWGGQRKVGGKEERGGRREGYIYKLPIVRPSGLYL